jgi:hypothetical protein
MTYRSIGGIVCHTTSLGYTSSIDLTTTQGISQYERYTETTFSTIC